MTSIATHEDLGTRIEDVLRQRFAERTVAAAAYGEEFVALWHTAAEHALGGKLIRPRLLLDVHRALAVDEPGASQTQATIEVAAHIELLHYAFLLHDDVIDGDLIRRRRPNLIGALTHRHEAVGGDRLHWARSSAILMGDLLLAAAVLGFARADVPHALRTRLLDLMDQTIMETVAGEHTDVALSEGVIAPDLRTILSMSAYKTATYSFGLPLRGAAILAGVDAEAEQLMASVGQHLGLAYQLQDDLLSVFGDPSTHGKDAHSDLREGKETAIIAYARMTSEWPSIRPLFGNPDLDEEDASVMRDGLRRCGAESFVASLVQEQLSAVSGLLDDATATGTIPIAAVQAILAASTRLESRSS